MNLLCRIGRHTPGEERVWNDGWFFGRCERCGTELLSRGRSWRPVPSGYRIVWRSRPPGYPDWSSVLTPRSIGPALEPPRQASGGR